jgi:hypothetical protein
MRRLRLLLLFFAPLFFLAPTSTAAQPPSPKQRIEEPRSQTVYITRTGKKYHMDGCRYLSQSKIPTSLKAAKANGYTPCKVCRPPQ